MNGWTEKTDNSWAVKHGYYSFESNTAMHLHLTNRCVQTTQLVEPDDPAGGA